MPVAHTRRRLRALVATSALGAGLAVGATAPGATAAPPTTPPSSSPAATPETAPDTPPAEPTVEAEVDDAPLAVTIGTMTPATLPTTGDVRLTGTVTNRSDEPWTNIALYAIAGDELDGVPVDPMRNPGELELAMAAPFDEVVGERITEGGTPGEVDELLPGASASYTVVVPADAVEVTRAGVYWFGVHAVGESESVPRDLATDGRARTFLPYVPRRFADTPVTSAVVVPLTHPVRYAADGSVDDEDGWTRSLSAGGRLAQLLDLVAAGPGPVTWVVDPALVDAVAHLAAGNAPRDLGPVPDAVLEDEPTGATPPATVDEPGATADPAEPDVSGSTTGGTGSDSRPAAAARAWLDELDTALEGDQVLTLPYGNVDVPATVAHQPDLLQLATAQQSTALRALGVETEPVVAPPTGYLDADSIAATDPGTRVLVTDRMFGERAPAVADVDGRRLLVTSYGATQGTPGPGRALTTVGVRQRLLAEAAVRVVKNERQPLVVVLPLAWALEDPTAFWAGLDVDWLELGSLDDVESSALASAGATTVVPEDLDYSALQQRRELDSSTVTAVADLVRAGDTLQNLLIDNTEIAGTITEEALTGLSYAVRSTQVGGRLTTGRSRSWVEERLGGVRISTSPQVTLASASGSFQVTLTNDLDHRVAVTVSADSDDGIEVTAPERIVLAPRSRETVLLNATTTTTTVHDVRLAVTDTTGQPLGSTDELPVRGTTISGVIWLIMGVGAGLLLLAIAVRLARRVAAARRGEPGAGRRTSPAASAPARTDVEVG